MQFGNYSLFGVILAALVWLSPSLGQGAEFTATMVTQAAGLEIPGKVFVKDQKMRNEIQTGGKTSIHILRPDKKLVWIIMPEEKIYMEMPISPEVQQKMLMLTENQKAAMKKIGSENLNGHACDKYETAMSDKGKSIKIFTYISTELGVPIKVVSEDKRFSMEYKDIKTEKVADSQFEPPQGYQKMKVPFAIPPLK